MTATQTGRYAIQEGTREQVVTVRGLRKSYAGRLVVDDVDLDVRRGQIVGLIGANGAGKTTTVECLQGLRQPDSGTIRVLGLDPVKDAERLRPQVGSQLQSSGLPDRMRVHEAMTLFAGPRASDPDSLLVRFGLGQRRKSAFGTMSGGEQQRLFLVLALLNRPRLVILDELTQGLDPAARREVWAAISQLRDGGTTVLLVTHELTEAEFLCDCVFAMRAGRLLDFGTPEALIARHAGAARVSFALSTREPSDTIASLEQLPGVSDVVRDDDQVHIHGAREAIAHVGAWLVANGPIPGDLRVDVPNLASALLGLLDADTQLHADPLHHETRRI